MAIRSPCPDINIPEVSLTEFILNKGKCFAERVAFIDDATGRTMTYGEFCDDVIRIARGLNDIGLEKDDVIALCLPNMIEYASIMYGGLLGGGTIAGVASLTVPQMKKIYNNANPRYIFTLTTLFEKVKNASSSCTHLQEIFTVDGTIDEARSYDELLKLGCEGELPDIKYLPEDDVALLVYTSGSTGDQKGASITHRNLVANVLQISSPMVSPYSNNDVTVATRPFTHAYGIGMHLMSDLYNGCTSILIDGYSLELMLKTVEKYKVTLLALIPSDLAHLNKLPAVCNYDVSSVKTVICAGAPLSCRVLEKFKTVFKIEDVRDMFGMTEVMPIFMPEINKPHLGVGIPLPNVEFKILDVSTGRPLGAGSKGELWVKSPSVCKGYKDKPEETKISFFDGWLKTGDVAYFDDNTNLYVIDRLNEFILYDAIMVGPMELEDVIQDLSGVESVVVVGVPDEDYHELSKAFVVKKPGSSLTEEDVISAVKASLDRYRWLHGGVEFVESLPKTASGKVMRRLVKENMLMKLKNDN